MIVSDIPLFGMIKDRMHWLSERQGVLAQNVANADTPGYVARDLKELDFSTMVESAQIGKMNMAQTRAGHLSGSAAGTSSMKVVRSPDSETSPTGNAVVLEEQMVKVADTQLQYDTATGLYSKSMSILKTALGTNR